MYAITFFLCLKIAVEEGETPLLRFSPRYPTVKLPELLGLTDGYVGMLVTSDHISLISFQLRWTGEAIGTSGEEKPNLRYHFCRIEIHKDPEGPG